MANANTTDADQRIRDLKIKRRTFKGQITSLGKYIDAYEDSAIERFKLQERIQRLRQGSETFNDVQNELARSETFEEVQDEREATSQAYDNVLARAMLLQSEQSTVQFPTNARTSTESPALSATSNLPQHVHLPKIDLPKFDGRREKWVTFKDAFQTMIHAHPGLSDVQKLSYLRLSLTGKAEAAIESFTICEDNYKAAWNQLIETYDNKRALVLRHADLILDTPAIPDDTPESICDLANYMQSHIRSLRATNRSWEEITSDLLVSVAIANMGPATRTAWEQTLNDTAMPRIEDVFRYLRIASHRSKSAKSAPNRDRVSTEVISHPPNKNDHSACASNCSGNYSRRGRNNSRKSPPQQGQGSPPQSPPTNRRQTYATTAKAATTCTICNNGIHAAYQCHKFLDMAVADRVQAAKRVKLCLNCLGPDHTTYACKAGRCRVCNGRHNSRLHQEHRNTTLLTDRQSSGLLATATIIVLDRNQQPIHCRTLIDTCSNTNFITEGLPKKLRLPTSKQQSVTIEALNQLNTVTNKLVSTTIKSRLSNFQRTLTFYTIPQISGPLPDTQIDRARLSKPPNIRLADPQFHRPASVDMLIGTGTALSCLSVGQIDLSPHSDEDLILQKTQLGWIIGGSVSTTPTTMRKTFVTTSLDFDMKKFWEVEEGPITQHLSSEEEACEDHFSRHVHRDESGRYIVALPFNEKKAQLGESRSRALNRFLSLERKLDRDPELRDEYTAVIDEYRALGHMTKVENFNTPGFYLPHHAVIKSSSATTKVRVVFDGSAKSNSGLSLNDTLMTGPTIQDDIFSLLLRFRMYAYVLTGDIEKMYRQFLIRPEDRQYQRILWRDIRSEIATCELNTVTFGLSSAPYLATRSIRQLADDEHDKFPTTTTTIKKDLYVDDLLTGADTYSEARALRDEIVESFQRGGLNIRQWASNEPRLLAGLSKEQIHPKILGDTSIMKTLGVSWDARSDSIAYTVEPQTCAAVTKRSVLSTIAKIFDPLGLLGPVTITAKMLMQRLWQIKVDWDESLPSSIHTEWTTFVNQFRHLHNVSFDRNASQHKAQTIELHGFCDASEREYGACLYIRSIDIHGKIKSNLLCAKSRVAPLKTVSLARLELCGAVLLASLFATEQGAITHNLDEVFFWTDSTIVLNWINKPPSTLKTFVANRVAEIQAKTRTSQWRHVRSRDNPADLLSRGLSPSQFLEKSHWRHGPEWLCEFKSAWPPSTFHIRKDVPEAKHITCLVTSAKHSEEFLHKFSDINKLRRVVAYCLRFSPHHRTNGPLNAEELRGANFRIIKIVQASAFTQDIRDLEIRELHTNSKLRPLHPFLDERGILRVGGRLQNATLPFDQKHPILLPKGHHITTLIIRQAHEQHHHAGITATLYNVRQAYWPIDGRNATRKIVRQCIRCFRVNPPSVDYIMGNLPAARVTENRPFHNCGIDYCGPFYIKERRFRNRARIKIYVAVFICFATKAVHLEVVSDLTTEAFIAALKRFVARRELCRNIYSDNGTNFVGADNEIAKLHRSLLEDEKVQRFLTGKEISWHFMPALSPHFGGLWEAAVKSFKHHVKRVVSEELLTFEQFNTFVVEIEAILNSRPLTPLSSDPNDPAALTPGHFLIGDSLTSMPEIDFSATPANRLSNWQHIQKVKQDFWARWFKEYINHLNMRHKWTKGSHDIERGTVVVLKEDNLPPLCWSLGRVEEIHPGADGIIRAVTVRTVNGSYRRNVKQLAPLPTQDTV